jgi:DNA modification methylase
VKPYYEHGGITIYHGDCMEILPQLKPVDLVLTDPPYGINMNTDYYTSRKNGQDNRADKKHAWHAKKYPLICGDNKPFDPSILFLMAPKYAFFGANCYSSKLIDSYSWIVWDKKTDAIPSNCFSDAELIYCKGANFESVRIHRYMWSGYQRQGEIGVHLHPTQKPVALIVYILNYFSNINTILDPFMGSGTTLRAAKDLGKKCVGIEIEEKYCEIAAQRLSQEVLPL